MSRDRDPYRTNDRRVIPWLLLGLVVLFGGVYVAAYAITGSPNASPPSSPTNGIARPATGRTTAEKATATT